MAASTQQGVSEEDLPTELQGRLTTFDNALSKIEEVLDPLHSVPLSEIHSKVQEDKSIVGDKLGFTWLIYWWR